tara:strand:- start:647 stop:760 length:114 start_codon:yes stop_codon:yes gene_type:complete
MKVKNRLKELVKLNLSNEDLIDELESILVEYELEKGE